MANRLNAPNQFETLSPPWILSQLDTNFTQNQAAWNDSSLGFVNGIPTDTGSANAYTVAFPFGTPSAYQDGMPVVFIPANTNTGGSTITVSPLGSVAILNPAGLALSGREIVANVPLVVVYKSAVPTGFRIIGPCTLQKTAFPSSVGNTTVNAAGYTAVALYMSPSAGGSAVSYTINNLGYGVPVSVTFNNSSGANSTFTLFASDPNAVSYSIFANTAAGGAAPINMGTTGGVFGNTFATTFNGITMSISGNPNLFLKG